MALSRISSKLITKVTQIHYPTPEVKFAVLAMLSERKVHLSLSDIDSLF
jgi:hypothetical protein